ncbi:MAG: helix-turn-helix transcriptional regulator [Ruminococcaceae bacterium]|nr:helix-turn-helix transcriptional regulator [Oscillospiraceae bacterium]
MNSFYEKQVGTQIRKIRMDNKLTQDQLTAKLQIAGCDITRSALAKIEVGQRHIYPDEIKALKQALRVTYEDILI